MLSRIMLSRITFFLFLRRFSCFPPKGFLLLVIFTLAGFWPLGFSLNRGFYKLSPCYFLCWAFMCFSMYVLCTHMTLLSIKNSVIQARRLSRFRDGRSSSPPGASPPPPSHTVHSAPCQLFNGATSGGRVDGLTRLAWSTAEVISHGGVSESDEDGSLNGSRLTRVDRISEYSADA